MKENVLKKFFVLTIALFAFCALSVGCQEKNNTIEYVNIVFETNGGSSLSSIKKEKGEAIANIDSYITTKKKSKFKGWYLDATFTQPVTNTYICEKDITLYAKWDATSEVEYVTITFATNGGSTISSIKKVKGEAITNIDAFITTKENNEFKGWYVDPNFTQPLTNTYVCERDVILYAKWEIKKVVEYVNITFETNGGSVVSSTKNVKGEAIANVNSYITTKEKNEFKGWYVDPDFTQPVTSTYICKEDVTLYAKWQVVEVTVIFDANGGLFDNASTIEVVVRIGKAVEKPVNPIRNGYVFIGWSQNQRMYNFNTCVDESITLLANWRKYQENTYIPKVTFAQQVNGWTGNGMNVKILVDKISQVDPFCVRYDANDKKVKQQNQRLVESAYDVTIVYDEYPNDVKEGPERIQYIKNAKNDSLMFNDVYVVQINSLWIQALVKDNCLAQLYDLSSGEGIFKEIGYKETSEGSGDYVSGAYEQDPIHNLATSNASGVYGYVPGKARPDYFMYFNADIIRNSGLPDPAELWFRGEWTWSRFEQYVSELQKYLNGVSTEEIEYKALALGYPEFLIGSSGATNNKIATVYPTKLNLKGKGVVDQLTKIQAFVNSGAYDKTRGYTDVASSFIQGHSVFVHGQLGYIGDSSKFPSGIGFEIGCVPYPTKDDDNITVLTTTDEDKAIRTSNGEKLKNAKGEYISGIDMSNSSFGVPFTSTSNCYSIINTPNGKNGINNKIIFAILYDLFECQGVNPDVPSRTEDEAYRSWLLTKKLASSIYVEAIMSVQENVYFELIEMASLEAGSGSQFGENTLWITIPEICTDPTKNVSTELTSLHEIYYEVIRKLGYSI